MFTSRQRRVRDLERRMAELDRLDAQYGLGSTHGLRFAPAPPRRRGGGRLVLLICVLGLGLVVGAPLVDRLLTSRDLDPVEATTTGSHAFLQTDALGAPMTWDPCRPIEYRVNPAGGPAYAVSAVRRAVAEVSAATGLTFAFEGTTTDPVEGASSPVTIGWGRADDFPQLRGDIVGFAGPSASGARRTAHYDGGWVVIESAPDLWQRPGDLHAVLLHELGHLVGLAHVEDPSELMAEENVGQTGFGPGDLEGLAALGRGGCTP